VIEDDEESMVDVVDESDGELWDCNRPLMADCKLSLLKFDDPEGKMVFWHSSSHLLGAAMELKFGAKLSIGPPVKDGFYYDAYMGEDTVSDADYKGLKDQLTKLTKAKHKFERLVMTKEELLEMFADNPFKVSIITNKVPDGGKSTAYKCGPFIDLCMGPHIADTGRIKAFEVVRHSSACWLGKPENDSMQRVYGIAFPDKGDMKKWKIFMEEAKKRDHRKLGTDQKLFFFHQLSPGSCFFEPHGARIYNKLVEFVRKQLWVRGYEEVVTPNIFNFDLWKISGHALHYSDAMFRFDVEGQQFGLKPMNCPAHCLLYKNQLRSYRDLPFRICDFGVLHRNELSGALTGLTRVRRFQQDDGHIFCTEDQIQEEVEAALAFMKFVYGVFGMTYKLELSTRPAKALGEGALWEKAESALARAMDNFAGKDGWKVNPGDGAFYGPKIDIKVSDALERIHQCATIQLDFQLPIRFDLKYRSAEQAGSGEGAEQFKRPVIIHRAMLGSVERMMAVLIEHYAGKFPLWLSPRQVMIVPVAQELVKYAETVREQFHAAGLYVDVDKSTNTLNKKVREASILKYNYTIVVGAKEESENSVTIRNIGNKFMSITDALAYFNEEIESYRPRADATPLGQ